MYPFDIIRASAGSPAEKSSVERPCFVNVIRLKLPPAESAVLAYKISTKGSEYLELKLSDTSGDLKAFLWDVRAIEGDLDAVHPDAVLWV